MLLPTKPVPAERKNPRVMVIYGPPKVGKTTILTALDNCLIVDCEEGSEHIEALKVKVNSLAELKLLAAELKKPESPKYKFIAIDTIDIVETWCEAEATTLYKRSPLGKDFIGKSVLTLPMGAGYGWLRAAFHEALGIIRQMASHIILIGHIRDKFIQEKEGSGVASKDLDLTGKIKSIVCANVDAIGYLSRDKKGAMTLNFKTTEEVVCGSRAAHLRGQTFEFNNPKEDWRKVYVE
jgi:hypothetical protein